MPTGQTADEYRTRRTSRDRSSRKWRILSLGLVVLIVLVAVGPTLIGMTDIPNNLLSKALPESAGKLSAGNVELSWLGATTLKQVRLIDTVGNALFEAERVEIDASLSELLLSPNNPLQVTVTEPIVNCQLDPRGSNWERFLAAYQQAKLAEENSDDDADLDQASQEDASERSLAFRILKGQLRITDLSTSERWSILLNEATYLPNSQLGLSQLSTAELSAIGTIESIGRDNAPSAVKGNFEIQLSATEADQQRLSAKLNSMPAALAGPFLRRSDSAAALKGWVSGEAQTIWARGASAPSAGGSLLAQLIALGVSSSGQLAVTDTGYRGTLTGGEPLELQRLEAPWQIAARQGGVVIDRATVRSEIGVVTIAGGIAPNEIESMSNGAKVLPAAMRLDADLNLVELARIAPGVLRLQQGVQIDEGEVKLQIATDAAAPQRLAGTLQTNRLVGSSAGKRIEWQKPLQANFTVSQGPQSWQLETLKASSKFANATLHTEPVQGSNGNRLRGTAKFNLDELAKELRQFVDLGDWQLAGTGNATGRFERSPDQSSWRFVGTGKLTEVMVGTPQQPLVAEPELQFEADLQGIAADTMPRIGNFILRAGPDQLTVNLSNNPNLPAGTRPLELKLEGEVARWHRRARLAIPNLSADETLQLSGAMIITAQGALNPTGGELTNWDLTIQNLGVMNSGQMRGQEELIKASGDLSWNLDSGVFFSRKGQFASSSFSFGSQNVELNRQRPSDSRGEFVFRGNMTRLQNWFAPSLLDEGWQTVGEMEGQALFSAQPDGMKLVAKLVGSNFQLLQLTNQTQKTLWSEPSLKSDMTLYLRQPTESQGIPTSAPMALEVEALTLDSQTVSGSARGRIGDLSTLGQVNLSGGVDYDLQKITALMLPSMGDSIELVGRDRATFEITSDSASAAGLPTGASSISRLKARVEAPWESANLFGLPVGSGLISATLDEGILKFDPLNVSVGQGRLTTQANVALTPPPTSVSLAPGPLVTDVAVSLEVAERILKFIAPVLSDAARIEGQFSLGLNEFAMPIKQPKLGRAQGVLSIQYARVLPGPAVAEWVALAQRVRGIVRDGVEGTSPEDTELFTIANQNVNFQMVEGRVYHERLDFNVGEVIVRTQGSVGLDESLDILLSIPILDDWVERRPVLLGGLRGQAVRIPIQGNLSDPQINRDALKQLSRDLLQSAAQGAINSGIDALFKRLQSK